MTNEQLESIRARVERSKLPDRKEWEYEDLSQIAWEDVPLLLDEVVRLRNALAMISLNEYESTTGASAKVHENARIARTALYGDK